MICEHWFQASGWARYELASWQSGACAAEDGQMQGARACASPKVLRERHMTTVRLAESVMVFFVHKKQSAQAHMHKRHGRCSALSSVEAPRNTETKLWTDHTRLTSPGQALKLEVTTAKIAPNRTKAT